MKKSSHPSAQHQRKTSNKRGAHPGGAGREHHAARTASRRHRGAQPGNHNALTHGFYSALFKDRERELLSKVPLTDLSSEIGLIRITTQRFLETLANSSGALDMDTQLTALRAINLSAHSIATLLRAHALAVEDPDALPGQAPGTFNDDAPCALDAIDPADTNT